MPTCNQCGHHKTFPEQRCPWCDDKTMRREERIAEAGFWLACAFYVVILAAICALLIGGAWWVWGMIQ